MKQVIIVRKDLNMSVGKVAAQVAHASMAFLTHLIQENTKRVEDNIYPVWRDKEHDIIHAYMNPYLYELAKQARENNQPYFHARPIPGDPNGAMEVCDPSHHYKTQLYIDNEIHEKWLNGIFTKIVCEAKNRNDIDKAIRIANELGLQENKDYFLIKDCCLTELTPEEIDENGVGRTLTCIGFRPLPEETANQISKKFQLLK